MNRKVPFLTRQIVYAFLVGLIAGGITIGLFDAYANQPLFSSAKMPGGDTIYCGPDGNAEAMGYVCGNPFNPTSGGYGEVTGWQINPSGGQGSGVKFIDPVDGGDYEGGPVGVTPR